MDLRNGKGQKKAKGGLPNLNKGENRWEEQKLAIIERHGLTKDVLHQMYYQIFLSRKLDDREIQMRKQNLAFFQISGAGHEGILVALGQVLRPKYDYFLPYYRDRALCLALGVTPFEMLCQAGAKIGDTSSYGRQMPAHWGNKRLNIISKSSCTGTQFNQAVGLAEGGRYLQEVAHLVENPPKAHGDEIIYTSCGDGTTSQGEFWEGLTSAVVKKLPVLFLVEDNGYAISVPVSEQTPGGSISKAMEHFPGLKVITCDGTCPIESYQAAKEAEVYLRAAKGPVLLHAKVTRPYSHSLSDDHRFYRTEKDLEEEGKRDVIKAYPHFLSVSGFLSSEEKEKLESRAEKEVRKAFNEMKETPFPEKDSIYDELYGPELKEQKINSGSIVTKEEDAENLPMATAINKTLRQEVKKNPLIRVFGEDVADFSELEKLEDEELKGKGGVFKVTSGVQRVGQKNQVFNSPLAEANIVGRAIGQAMRGLKPVVEIQFFDYIWPAYMQIKNELATMRYRSGGDYTCPMVIRVPIGGYLRGGSIYHSQSGESHFTHIPGLRVVFPSNARDAAGLLRHSIYSNDPVLFLEHKHLYYQGYNRTPDPGPDYEIPFGQATVLEEGRDATVLCWGALVQKCLNAAKVLEEKGHSIEVIDARTLAPFDLETLKKSLQKTGRLLVAHEEVKTSGFAGEVCALVNEHCFELLDAPVIRVAAKDTHVAYCPDLEDLILPQVENVVEGLEKLLRY